MLDLGCWVWVAGFRCWIWAAGWGVRPRATRIEGTSEQPGSSCRAAMHGCWQGVGGLAHPPVSLLPSPSCCGYPVSGFSTLVKRKQYRRMSALAPSPILQPSTLESLRWWGLQQLARYPGAPTPLLPPPPPHPALRISLTRQQPAGTTGIRGETSEGCSLSQLEHQRLSPGMGCGAVEAERTREHPMGWGQGWGCGKGCAVGALRVLGCGVQGPHCPPATLPTAAPGPRCAARPETWEGSRGQGRVPGCRHPSRHAGSPAGRGGEGRERRPRRGAAPGAPVMHYWKHLAWAAGACSGCTRMCTHAHGYGDTHMHIWIYGCVYISTCIHTCVHSCSCVHTYPYVCTHTYTGMEVCTHM